MQTGLVLSLHTRGRARVHTVHQPCWQTGGQHSGTSRLPCGAKAVGIVRSPRPLGWQRRIGLYDELATANIVQIDVSTPVSLLRPAVCGGAPGLARAAGHAAGAVRADPGAARHRQDAHREGRPERVAPGAAMFHMLLAGF